jgi:transcriptional regulator with XRE-family HTH domain
MENNLKKCMENKDIRVIDLARMTQIHYSKISRIRHGVEGATDRQKRLIANTLKCSMKTIFPDTDDAPPSGNRDSKNERAEPST